MKKESLTRWIKAYRRAAIDTNYMRKLANIQKIGQYSDEELKIHYAHHADQYVLIQEYRDKKRFATNKLGQKTI